MIWNCDGKVTVIEFRYSSAFKEYCCCVNTYIYAWEEGGPWDWFRKGYTATYAGWV